MKKKTVDCLETTVSPMDILEISRRRNDVIGAG